MKNVPGRAKTDKKDAVWLAKLTERGMLQPSFIPAYDIRRLREFTRLRAELVHERTRHWSRLEKLLERALIKVTSVASAIDTMSCRDMTEALIAGQRDPGALADLARGKLRAKRKELINALDGKFEDHHAVEEDSASVCRSSPQSPMRTTLSVRPRTAGGLTIEVTFRLADNKTAQASTPFLPSATAAIPARLSLISS